VAVELRIRTSKEVRRYAHLDKRDAKAEFARIFRKNPDLVASITPADLPESFPVQLERARDATAFAHRMRSLPGVESAELKAEAPTEADMLATIRQCQERDVSLEVFMTVDATQGEIDAAVGAVAAEPGLTVTRLLSKDDAYAEFRRVFASKPKLVNSVIASDLPVSVRVHAASGVSADALTRLRSLPGVDSVATPLQVCDPIQKLLDGGLTPEALARLMVQYSGGLPA
jgi:cell division protein FtsX